jgi:hypothetical protein
MFSALIYKSNRLNMVKVSRKLVSKDEIRNLACKDCLQETLKSLT